MSQTHCGRCKGKTDMGERCQRQTCKVGKYCWQHLEKEYGLQVKTSTIPGGGMGLFATRDIVRAKGPGTRKDVPIIEYTGKVRYNTGGAYVLCEDHNRCIDARSTQSSVARYSNGCDNPAQSLRRRCNARFGKRNGRMYLLATKTIKAGVEILSYYESEYWN